MENNAVALILALITIAVLAASEIRLRKRREQMRREMADRYGREE